MTADVTLTTPSADTIEPALGWHVIPRYTRSASPTTFAPIVWELSSGLVMGTHALPVSVLLLNVPLCRSNFASSHCDGALGGGQLTFDHFERRQEPALIVGVL